MRDFFNKIVEYLTFRKNEQTDGYLKQMHIMNKISIFMFLVGIIVLINRCM